MATTRTRKSKATPAKPAPRTRRRPTKAAVAAASSVAEAADAPIDEFSEATVSLADAVATEASAAAEAVASATADAVEAAVHRSVEAAKAAEETLESVEKAVHRTAKAARKSAGKAAKASAETLEANFAQAFATRKQQYESIMQNFSDLTAAGRENMDAVVTAGTVFAKGIEAVNAEIAAITKRNMEDSIAAAKALSSAKTAKEYFELQTDLMKTSWDHMIADTTKIGEMLGEYSKDAMAPIQSRITAAMERLSKPLTL
jgi:phasin family protein